MEKQQAEFADSPMLKFSTYSAGLRQWCFLKVSEPEVRRCGEFEEVTDVGFASGRYNIHTQRVMILPSDVCFGQFCSSTVSQTGKYARSFEGHCPVFVH